jgi:methionyl-tRNA synthetase
MKMSKSRGNVVNPFTELNRLGNDAIRYYLLKEGSLQHDGDYNDERINSSLNVDLADTLGNLLQRCTAASINPSQTIPTPPQAADITPADRILEDAMKWLCGKCVLHKFLLLLPKWFATNDIFAY